MAATAAELDRLVAAYQEALIRLASAHESIVERLWLQMPDERAVQQFLATTDQFTTASRRQAARLAATFFDSYVVAATDRIDDLPAVDIDGVVARVRGGADLATVYGEQIDRALAIDDQWSRALADTAPGVGQVADQDVTLSARAGTTAANDRHGITSFRRRAEPTACPVCRGAAQRTYRRPDLRPIHGHCHCVVVPDVGATSTSPTVPDTRRPRRAAISLGI